MKKEHLNGLEILRYALGIYIVLYHTGNHPDLYYFFSRFVSMGFIATSTFFILSGFILSYVYLSGNGTQNVILKGEKSDFLKKRFANLYPIHIFSLLLFILIFIILSHLNIMPRDDKMVFTWVAFDVNNYADGSKIGHFMSNFEIGLAFFMNIFMIQSWNPYYLTFNSPAWSISTLFFMYILFPFIAPRLSKISSPFKALTLTNFIYILFPITFIILGLFDKPYSGILNRNPLVRLPEFIAGILLCNIYFYLKSINFTMNKFMVIFTSLFIIFCFYLSDRFLANPEIITSSGNAPYYLLHTGLILIPECLIIYLFTQIKINSERSIYWWKRLGGASLPMFALHIPLYFIFSRVEYYFFGKIYLELYILFPIIVTIVCIYFQEYIVIPVRKTILKILEKKNKVLD